MKTIRLLFVLGFILTVFSCDKDDDVELTSFDVVKETITPSYTTADIACEFSTRATVKNVFIHYSKNADFSDYEEQKMIEKDGKFSASLSALQWNTTYYIRYAAKNSYSSAVTKKVSQAKTLEATVPTINIEQISNVLDKTASVRVALVFDGGVAVSEYGVCLNSNATPTVDGYHVVANNEQTTISLSGLKENTTYRMRAYAKNEIGVGYSKQFSFTTLDLPKVRTDEFSDIQHFSLRLHATAVSTGNDTTAAFGFCWAEQTNPTIENNSTKVAVEKDTFSYLLSNLEDGTTYYVRAYAKNKIGVVYGEEKSFTTQPAVKPTVSTTAATDISYTSATIGGNVTSDGGVSVTERGICYSTSQNPTTSSSKKTSGSGTGSFSVSLTGLSNGTTYYARAYATNKKGTSYGEQKTFTTKSYTKATVSTTAATDISYISVTVGGNVTSDGGTIVTERGICYSTSQNPTITNNKVISGNGIGSFTCNLTDLQDETTYYVRAYAINTKGISYGEQKSFTTKAYGLPTITTSSATNISYTSATVGGNVKSDGGVAVTERGIVYSTTQNPTTSNSKVTSGSGTGSFTCSLSNLQKGTTYYVRAYAINEKGVCYGENIVFKTLYYYFSISTTKKVEFSPGNLQYHPRKDKWRFAPSQLDYIGGDNENISSTYSGWLDLFGWSTGATNFGVSTSTDDRDYSGSFVDWGSNQIGNDAPNTWRTLTGEEWFYLRSKCPNYSNLCGVAQVNGVNGLIFLPDNWTCPAGVTFRSGFHDSDGVYYYAAYQTFTAAEWSKMEVAGAVFLPAAGERVGSGVSFVRDHGNYWSTTEFTNCFADYLYFYSGGAGYGYDDRYYGRSVRLVKDL